MLSYPRILFSLPHKFQRKTYWIASLASLAFIIVWLFPFQPVGVDLKGYAPLHTVLETFAVVIAGIIFAVGWHARVSRETDILAILAIGFLGVALLDTAHILSFKNMPQWFTPSGNGKAIHFWFLARYLAAFTLILFVIDAGNRKFHRGMQWLALAAVLIFVALAYWVVLTHFHRLPVYLIPGEGLTSAKIQQEWLLTLIFLVALLLVWRRRKKALFYDPGSLMVALWLSCLSELCFTLYSNSTDIFNLMGHVYKVMSYGFLYRAIVVGCVNLPYNLLAQSQEILQQLVDNIHQVFWMTSPDKRQILYMSPAYETIWQRKRSDMIESPMSWMDSVHPEDINRVKQYLSVQSQGVNSIDYRITRPDGTVRHIRSRTFPICDDHGKVLRVAGVGEDLTEEIKAQEALQKNERLLEQTQSIAHLGSWEFDILNNTLTWSNEVYRIFGLSPQECPSTYETFLAAVHPDDRERVNTCYLDSIKYKQDHYEIEHRIVRKHTNEIRHLHEKCFHVKNETGEVIRSIGMVHDITDRKLAEIEQTKLHKQLVQAQKMEAIGHLTGGIAHDFNNMLGSIIGYNDLLSFFDETNIDFDKQKHFINEIRIASKRAKDLIAQMMIFSRPKPEIDSSGTSVISLQPVVKEIMQLLRLSIPRTIDIGYRFKSKDPKACIDPVQLHQILMNLTINARDACGEYGQIEIEVDQQIMGGTCSACHENISGEYVVLSVHDNGHGIAEDIQSKIFDPFFSTKEIGKGSGMGLSVVHGMVHSQGGHIIVVSGGPKRRTSIEILLRPPPENDDKEEKIPQSQALLVQDNLLAGLDIMVVDDESSMANFLREILELYGARVSLFCDPLKAISTFESNPQTFDLVITDTTMPKLSGLDMSRRMLNLRGSLPVILCTGYSESVSEEIIKQIGISKLLYKPISSKLLIDQTARLAKRFYNSPHD